MAKQMHQISISTREWTITLQSEGKRLNLNTMLEMIQRKTEKVSHPLDKVHDSRAQGHAVCYLGSSPSICVIFNDILGQWEATNFPRFQYVSSIKNILLRFARFRFKHCTFRLDTNLTSQC